MLKKIITYQNPFTEQEVSEEHYFHISKADLVEMEMEEHSNEYTDKKGEKLTGMQAKLQRIVDSQDGKAIMSEIKDMIRRSYGRKSGDRFLKSKEIRDDFASSEAFSQLFFDLCTDAKASAEFMNGIIPSNLEQIAAEVRQKAEEESRLVAKSEPTQEETVKRDFSVERAQGVLTDPEVRVLTTAEIVEMDKDELQSGLATGRYKLN